MARGGFKPQPQHFTGHQTMATPQALDAFVRDAAPGASFVYCEAPAPRRGDETWLRAGEHAQAGLVRTHQERREGGGWRFYVVRTGYRAPAPIDPVARALADPATAVILLNLKRAANLGAPCPSDTELALRTGLNTRNEAQWRFRKLVNLQLIESTLAYEGGVPCRVVTILTGPHAGRAAGKSTALPKKWAALQRAAELELKQAGGSA